MPAYMNLRKRNVAGAVAGDLVVTGIKLGDRLISVMPNVASADLVDEFAVTADDTINNAGGTSTAAQVVTVLWEVYGGGVQEARVNIGRAEF